MKNRARQSCRVRTSSGAPPSKSLRRVCAHQSVRSRLIQIVVKLEAPKRRLPLHVEEAPVDPQWCLRGLHDRSSPLQGLRGAHLLKHLQSRFAPHHAKDGPFALRNRMAALMSCTLRGICLCGQSVSTLAMACPSATNPAMACWTCYPLAKPPFTQTIK